MKKRDIIIILVSVIAIVGLFLVGYSWMKKNDERMRHRGVFEIVRKYVEADTDFTSRYGAVTDMELSQEESFTVINNNEYHVPCVVSTESGQYLVWVDVDFWGEEAVFRYLSVDNISEKT